MAKTNNDKEYRTLQFKINNKHPLFSYCDNVCLCSKNLYNIANFYIRQCFFGLQKDETSLNENESTIINLINSKIDDLNKIKTDTFEKRKNYKNNKTKEKTLKLFKPLNKDNKFPSYNVLDGIFKLTKQSDYISLPAQTNQNTLKLLYQDWKSFFNAIKEYKINPSNFTGRPKLPKYAKKNGRKVVTHTNQSCKIRTDENNNKYLILPKTKLTLNLSNMNLKSEKLKSVRIIPNANYYVIEIILEVDKSVVLTTKKTSKRIISIDLGIDNFATLSNNIGINPIIIKGNNLKSYNQFYNKQRAYYYSVLRIGKSQKEGQFSSKRLNYIDTNRHYYIKDFFHKKAKYIVTYCVKNNIDTIVIGKNKNWKTNVKMHKKDKQNFIGIPYNQFISILTYKANEKGILVLEQEESYTSKASFLDNDKIPTYSKNINKKTNFSGRRIKRGLYKTKNGVLINADVNGASNILKKCFKKAFKEIDNFNYLLKPQVV